MLLFIYEFYFFISKFKKIKSLFINFTLLINFTIEYFLVKIAKKIQKYFISFKYIILTSRNCTRPSSPSSETQA